MKTISVLTILVIATFSSFAQTDLNGRYELGGSVAYFYDSMNGLGDSKTTTHDISFRPNVGLFLTPSLEVTIGPTISLMFRKVGATSFVFDGFTFFSPPYEYEYYSIGFTPGIKYHFILDGSVAPYVAVSGTLYWQRQITSTFNPPSVWSKPSIYAPTVDAGVRIFLSNDWALQVALTYSRNLQQQGDNNRNGYTLALGTGFAIFL